MDSLLKHTLRSGLLSLLIASATALPLHAQVNVVTWHNDLSRTGQNLNETILTPANVNFLQFGQLFQYPVDGNVYAQPLYLPAITIPGQGLHNVLFICTAHNSVYAFDADTNSGASSGLLWHVNLGPSAATPNNVFGNRDGPYGDIVPEVGIIGTPTIDPATGTLYVDAFTNDSGTIYNHRIHALSIYDGTEKFGGPLLVTGTCFGAGAGGTNGIITFADQYSLQRPALTFLSGKLFVAYTGYADTNPYHGWLIAFNTSPTLSSSASWVSTPDSTTAVYGEDAGEGGIWMGGCGVAVDPNNNDSLFCVTANGSYGNPSGGFTNPTDFGDAFVKLSASNLPAAPNPPLDWFTPYNQATLQANDVDLGSGGTLLFPNGVGSSAHPHLMVGGGKAGVMYLIDRDMMTTGNIHYNTAGPPDPVVQTMDISSAAGIFSTPAYFNGAFYYAAQKDVMRRYTISNGVIAGPTSSGIRIFGHPGDSPSVSASGTSNGIVWAVACGKPAVLVAFNASNVTNEIYNSGPAGTRDQLPNGVKFVVPTVVNGKVYVGGNNAVSIFGLIPSASSPPAASTGLSAKAVSVGQINLVWTNNATNANGIEILRSIDGVNFTFLDVAPGLSGSFADTTPAVNSTYYYKVCAENTAGVSAASNIASATTPNNQANVGLVAHWPLTDGAGLTATDTIGGDNGTLSGNVTWAPGVTGIANSAVSFQGGATATRIDIPDEPAIDFSGTQSFSLTAWVNAANTVGKYSDIIAKSRAATPWYGFAINPANDWIISGPQANVTGTAVTPGWHHLAAVQNGPANTRTFYIDGAPFASGRAQPANGTGEMVFGAGDGVNESYSGSLDDVRIYDIPLPAAQVATLAQTTWTDSDIGSVGLVGSATVDTGTFTVIGSGADIWTTADAFHYMYQQVSGDCIITARVTAVQNICPWSKVGVMIRQSLDPGSTFADCFVTPSEGVNLQYRTVANTNCGWTAGINVTAPYWVRLTRTGNVITGFESPDGNTWTKIGSVTITMTSTIYVGLCTCAHENTALCTGTFDNVSVTQ